MHSDQRSTCIRITEVIILLGYKITNDSTGEDDSEHTIGYRLYIRLTVFGE